MIAEPPAPSFDSSPITPTLPSPPPSVKTKGPTIWDKDHISETLAQIGAGFLGSQNFSDGLGAASLSIAGRNKQLRDQRAKSVTYGGPDNQFEITTDGMGNRSVRQVPQFHDAHVEDLNQKNQPSAKDKADLRARALYAVGQLPQEQRGAAYADLVANPDAYGVDTTGMPAQWSERYGTMGGMMGLNVDQSLTQERANIVAHDQIDDRKARLAQGAQRIAQGAVRVAQGDARVAQGAARVEQGAARLSRLPKAPPGLKGYSAVSNKAQYDALPSGSKYIAPDGTQRIKK